MLKEGEKNHNKTSRFLVMMKFIRFIDDQLDKLAYYFFVFSFAWSFNVQIQFFAPQVLSTHRVFMHDQFIPH